MKKSSSRVINIDSQDLSNVTNSYNYPTLSPSTFFAILNGNFFKSGFIFVYCNRSDFKLCLVLCHLLAINPFHSVSVYCGSSQLRFNFFGSIVYLLVFSAYSFLVAFFALLSLAFSIFLVAFSSSPEFNSYLDFDACIYWTSSFYRSSLRGGSIGHIKGVLSVLDKNLKVSLFSTRNFFSELSDSSNHNEFIPYSYPPFVFPDIDIYALAVSFHQSVSFFFRLTSFSSVRSNSFFIYTRLSRGGFAAAIASFILRVPLIVEYNGSEVSISNLYSENFHFFAFISRLSEHLLLKRASRVVTVSEVLANELAVRYPNKSIRWYPNCADKRLLSFDSVYSPNVLSFSYVSTFGRWHGAELIPLAVNHILENSHAFPLDNIPDFIFQIVGGGISYGKFCDSISSLNLQKYFLLHGFLPHDQALRIISESQFSLLPTSRPKDDSLFIGSPTKLFEYMSLASIPIASNVGQQSSIVFPALSFPLLSSTSVHPQFPSHSPDYIGLTFEADCFQALGEAIYFALSNYSSISSLHQNCRNKVLSSYTWETNVRKLLT